MHSLKAVEDLSLCDAISFLYCCGGVVMISVATTDCEW